MNTPPRLLFAIVGMGLACADGWDFLFAEGGGLMAGGDSISEGGEIQESGSLNDLTTYKIPIAS